MQLPHPRHPGREGSLQPCAVSQFLLLSAAAAAAATYTLHHSRPASLSLAKPPNHAPDPVFLLVDKQQTAAGDQLETPPPYRLFSWPPCYTNFPLSVLTFAIFGSVSGLRDRGCVNYHSLFEIITGGLWAEMPILDNHGRLMGISAYLN